MTTKRSVDEYHRLLAEKADLLAGYRDTTLGMKAALGTENSSLLQGYIRKRQQLIGRIEKIDNSILGLKPADKPGGLSADRNGDLKKLLVEISELDTQCIDLAHAERNTLKDQLVDYRQKRRFSKNYRSNGAAPAKFVNTRIV